MSRARATNAASFVAPLIYNTADKPELFVLRPDALIVLGDGRLACIEFKTRWSASALPDQTLRQYWAQALLQSFVSLADVCVLQITRIPYTATPSLWNRRCTARTWRTPPSPVVRVRPQKTGSLASPPPPQRSPPPRAA